MRRQRHEEPEKRKFDVNGMEKTEKNKMAVGSLIVLCILILAILFADFLTPYTYDTQDLKNTFQYPSSAHPFGTDNFGRDILTRVLYGGRISLFIALSAVFIGLIIGGILGATAGYFGGIYVIDLQ